MGAANSGANDNDSNLHATAHADQEVLKVTRGLSAGLEDVPWWSIESVICFPWRPRPSAFDRWQGGCHEVHDAKLVIGIDQV